MKNISKIPKSNLNLELKKKIKLISQNKAEIKSLNISSERYCLHGKLGYATWRMKVKHLISKFQNFNTSFL